MDHIAIMFIQFVPDLLQYADDIADRTVRILHAHVDDAAVIGDAVKGGMHFDASLAELLPMFQGKTT